MGTRAIAAAGAAVFTLTLTGCPPAPPRQTASGKATTHVEQTPGRPPTYLQPGDDAGEEAYFVRVRAAELGGRFDTLGKSEVCFFLDVGGRTVEVGTADLALPEGGVQAFALEHLPWAELVPARTHPLELSVQDRDATEYEFITGTAAPEELAVEDFGPEGEPAALELELTPVRVNEGALLEAKTQRVISGATATLELVRAPRRTAADDASRAAVADAFGPVLAAAAPEDPAAARPLSGLLAAAMDDARAAAGRSTHTYAREVLPDLAERTADVQELAARATAADPVVLRNLQRDVRDALAALAGRPALPEERRAAAEALAEAELSWPLDAGRLDDLADRARRLRDRVRGDMRAAGPGPADALRDLRREVDGLAEGLAAAAAGVRDLAKLGPALTALQAALADEAGLRRVRFTLDGGAVVEGHLLEHEGEGYRVQGGDGVVVYAEDEVAAVEFLGPED